MRTLIIFLVMAFIWACNDGVSRIDKKPEAKVTDSLINNLSLDKIHQDYAKGAMLIGKNDCLTCHSIKENGVGPSYEAIAAKYPFAEGVVENLSRKIITGGKGLWGEKEMTPHPNLAFADAAEMVRYILSLDEGKQ